MFTRTKRFGIRMITLVSIGVIVSFILSIIAAYVQDNNPVQYNVMGITMPPWFYFVLALNAVVFIFGGGNGVFAAYSFLLESGALKFNRSENSDISEVEQEAVPFESADEDTAPVYDPQLALTR